MTTLAIHMGAEFVGTLDTSNPRNLRLAYDPSYVNDPGATPLSVAMPLRATAYTHAVVHPYLWGLLPDNDRVIDRWARELGCSASDIGSLLAGVGTDVAGAAQYVDRHRESEQSAPGHIDWVDTPTVEQFLTDVVRDTSAWRPRAEGRWSLAGAQAKIALHYDPGSGRWGVPTGLVPTTHIVKPAIAGLAEFDLNEHLCLTAARNLGISAARTSVRRFGRHRALVVERYDRIRRDGEIVRVHQEDLCQALGIHPDRKYESDGGPGVDAVGRLVDEVADPDSVRRVLDALALGWLLLSTDGHAKNLSLLLSGHRVRLAPLYDIASGLPYLHARKARLAQRIGGEYRPTFIERRHWARVARQLSLDEETSIDRLRDLADRLPDALSDAARASDLDKPERTFATRLRDDIAAWTPRARRALNA